MNSLRALCSRIVSPHTYSNEAYVNYLRKNGVRVGTNTRFVYPRKCHVDIHRGEYIHIGDNCVLSQASILAHDYSWYVLNEAYGEMLPDPGGEVFIGNNCFIGYQALILKGTHIGDNVIIGARSVVTGGELPSNTVWAGSPAKQICTLEEFLRKRKSEELKSIRYRKGILDKRSAYSKEDFGWFMLYFTPRTEENYQKYFADMEFNDIKDSELIRNYFFSSKPRWDSYEQFLTDIGGNELI